MILLMIQTFILRMYLYTVDQTLYTCLSINVDFENNRLTSTTRTYARTFSHVRTHAHTLTHTLVNVPSVDILKTFELEKKRRKLEFPNMATMA